MKSMKSGFARAKVPCLEYLDVLSIRIGAKNKRIKLSRTLKRMCDQRLTAAHRPIWSPGIFELNLKSL